jgi:hypothetical protein
MEHSPLVANQLGAPAARNFANDKMLNHSLKCVVFGPHYGIQSKSVNHGEY